MSNTIKSMMITSLWQDLHIKALTGALQPNDQGEFTLSSKIDEERHTLVGRLDEDALTKITWHVNDIIALVQK